MKKLIAIITLLSQCALAGDAPTQLRTQSGAKISASFFVVPANQGTRLGSSQALIETGNTDLLANPSFEASAATSSWTAGSGVTAAVNTSTYFDGLQAVTLTFSSVTAGETLWYQDVTPGSALTAVNGLASLWVNSSQNGNLEVCPRAGGSTVTTACTPLTLASSWQQLPANFVFPSSGSVGVALVAINNISSGTAVVDTGYLGIATNIGSAVMVTPWVPYSVTITGATTNPSKGTSTVDQGYWRQVGDTMEFRYDYVQTAAGSAGSGTYYFNLPPGYTIDSTKMNTSGGNANGAVGSWSAFDGSLVYVGTVTVVDTSHVALSRDDVSIGAPYVASNYVPLSDSTLRYSFIASVPISGWAQSGMVYSGNLPTQPQVTVLTSGSGTYTVPPGATRLEVKMVGGGGGGSGGGSSSGSGNNGGNTTFGSSLLTADGGNQALSNNFGAGGSYSIASGVSGFGVQGGSGSGDTQNGLSFYPPGGIGGSSALGGGGGGGAPGTTGGNGATNTGGGGGGGGTSGTEVNSGAGGGSGGYIDAMITSNSSAWASSYSYSVGSGGSGGGAGTSGYAGGAGGSGAIIVTAFFGAQPLQFVGQVSSNTSGQEHVERATLVCSSSSSVSSQSGSWITGTGNVSSGACTYTIATGEFSASPTCVVTLGNQNPSLTLGSQMSVGSATSFTITGSYNDGGTTTALSNYSAYVICMGPR